MQTLMDENAGAWIADLERLQATHFVELTTTMDHGKWHLSVTKRKGGYSAKNYTGGLGEVIAQAVSEAK